MIVNRVEKHHIGKKHPLYEMVDNYSLKSKNLYNFANYIVRQSFIGEGKYIPYNELTKVIKHELPFKDIGSNSGQHTLKYLHNNWKSYFVAIKDWEKNKNKYLGKPKIPKYLDKDGRFIWILTNLQSKVINGELVFSFKPLKKYNGLIKTNVNGKHMQTRFIPKKNSYTLEIVYEKVIPDDVKESKRIIGIDLGVNNFASIQNNFGEQPFVINGRLIKSYNNFYNKNLATSKSKAMKVNNLHWTNKMQRLNDKRHNKMDHFMHNASRYIVNYCIAFNVDTVVIGYNPTWKQSVKMGNKTQSFVAIPFMSFINKLEYKLEEVGIKLIKTEESYTSRANFKNSDLMKKNSTFTGKRIERGLYKTEDGSLINADINGASNIIRKVFPKAFVDGIEGVGLHPVIVNVV